ncbi:hypothetical protein BKA66DRAFT_477026 [Pyrenochaeta sp. MPI-SDFR-AT-0127]|nr:hypothetical protein BKA66DRAFT_477026 [Pyrenochaeta sp. MPI-SDFR-AT-0127]
MTTPHSYPKEDQGHAILAATLTVTIVAGITFGTRLFVRVKMIQNVGWDDYTMGVAMMLCVAGQIVIIPQVRLGAGKHLDQIPPDEFQQAFKLNFVTQPLYLFAIMLIKESIGFFLLRIAITPFYRRTIISVMVFMAVYTTACFVTIVLQCTNLAVLWDPEAEGTCWGATTLKALGYTNVALNITTDLLFSVIIPIPMLWKVQMNRRQKSSVIGILGLGIFATAAAFVKMSYLPNYGKTGDWLWDSHNITIWTVTESNIGIIAGNLPCMKPLFRSVLGSTYGRGSRNRTTSKYLPGSYNPGTDHKSVRNYDSLGSSRTREEPLRPYGVSEAHMMTTIRADKEKSGEVSGLRNEVSSKNSEESLVLPIAQTQIFSKLGGIKKTTEVNITESSGEIESIDETTQPGLKETQMV